MKRPATFEAAARVLVELAHVEGNPTAPYDERHPPEVDPLGALTRRELDDAEVGHGRVRTTVGALMQRARVARAGRDRVDLDAPPVLVAVDGERMRRIAEPVRESSRPSVVVAPAPAELGPTPGASHALTVAGLTARDAARQVEEWAARLPLASAKRARVEASAYRDYAAVVQGRLSASFAWLDDLDEPALRVVGTSPPPMPVQLRGRI